MVTGELSYIMISAPVMILGVIAGAILCFSGNPLRRFWFPLRCFLFGAAIMVLGVQFILDWPSTAALFENGATFKSFFALMTTDAIWWHTLLKVLAGVGGGVACFFLGRAKNKLAVFMIKVLTAFTTACTTALLIAIGGFGVVTVPMACVIAGVLTVVLIPVCVARFDYYYAAETGLAGALLTSYLFARFYYFSSWLFWLITIILAFCGIYLQERAALRRRVRDSAASQLSQPSPSTQATVNAETVHDAAGASDTSDAGGKPKKRRGKKTKGNDPSPMEPGLEVPEVPKAPAKATAQANVTDISDAGNPEGNGSSATGQKH